MLILNMDCECKRARAVGKFCAAWYDLDEAAYTSKESDTNIHVCHYRCDDHNEVVVDFNLNSAGKFHIMITSDGKVYLQEGSFQ